MPIRDGGDLPGHLRDRGRRGRYGQRLDRDGHRPGGLRRDGWSSTATGRRPARRAAPTSSINWEWPSTSTRPSCTRCLDELGIAFLFAPSFTRASDGVARGPAPAPVPDDLQPGGPALQPGQSHASARGGSAGGHQARRMAEVLAQATRIRRALVVTGCDGLDEVTLDGPTRVRDRRAGPGPGSRSGPRTTSAYHACMPRSCASRVPRRAPGCCGGLFAGRARAGPRDRARQCRRGTLDDRSRARFRRAVSTARPRAIDSGAAAAAGRALVRADPGAALSDADARGRSLEPAIGARTAMPGRWRSPARRSPGRSSGWPAPVFVEQSLLYLIGLSDTIVAGRYLAAEHLAGVTVASYLLWFLGTLFTIGSIGGTALVATIGRGRANRRGHSVLRAGVRGGAGAGTCSPWCWCRSSAPGSWLAMNLTGLAAESAARFLRIVGAVMPLLACTAVGNACLRGAGDTRTGMKVMILMNVVNIGLTWLLAVGWGPIPALGSDRDRHRHGVRRGDRGSLMLAVLIRGRAGLRLTWRNAPAGPGPDQPALADQPAGGR